MSSVQKLMENTEKRIHKKIDSARRSVLHDLDKKVKEIKDTLILNSTNSGMNMIENRQILDIELPIRDPEAFSKFDTALATAPDEEKALKFIMTSTILGIAAGQKAVVHILQSIIAKPVQAVYSGSGRKIRGNGKENFSKTNTYLYMRDVVCESEHITDGISHDQILRTASRWLSGCVDREGGRVRQAAQVRPTTPVLQGVPVVPPVVQDGAIVDAAAIVQAVPVGQAALLPQGTPVAPSAGVVVQQQDPQ